MTPTLQISPIVEQPKFVTLEAAKKHLKLELNFDYDDALINAIILAAIGAAENYTGRNILQKNVVMGVEAWSSLSVIDEFPIVDKSVAVKYYDTADESQDLADGVYRYYESSPYGIPYLSLVSEDVLPNEIATRPDAVRFEFVTGMTVAELPKPMYQAILLMIGDMYEYRTDRTEVINRASYALMRPYKVWA